MTVGWNWLSNSANCRVASWILAGNLLLEIGNVGTVIFSRLLSVSRKQQVLIMSAGWLTLFKSGKCLYFMTICYNIYSKTLSADALWPRHNNQAILCLNLTWPLSSEHNDQTLDTNGRNDCPSQCVCSSFTQGQSSCRGSGGSGGGLHSSVQRSLSMTLLCILLWFSEATVSRPRYCNCTMFKTHLRNVRSTEECWECTYYRQRVKSILISIYILIIKDGCSSWDGEASLSAAKPLKEKSMNEFRFEFHSNTKLQTVQRKKCLQKDPVIVKGRTKVQWPDKWAFLK